MALTRDIEPMPPFVADMLATKGLRAACDARPPCQRNDYLGWINRAKRDETRARRLQQMLAELQAGEGYMNMPWRPKS